MGLKFRKRVTVFPGFTLNVSKSGISSTLGVKGFSMNMGKKGSYLNLGLPGSGIYERIRLDAPKAGKGSQNNQSFHESYESRIEYLQNEIRSKGEGKMSDEIGQQIKRDIKESALQRKKLKFDLMLFKGKVAVLFLFYICGLFLYKPYKNYYTESNLTLTELQEALSASGVKLHYEFDSMSQKLYDSVLETFSVLCKSEKVWDVTSERENDRKVERSAAARSITRTPTSISESSLEYISSDISALKFVNKNGGDIFLYPGYVIIEGKKGQDIFELKNLSVSSYENRFVEEEKVPSDSSVHEYTYAKVNKDGSPDKRHTGNYQIPIAEYGNIVFQSSTGVNEEFCFSNQESLMKFAHALNSYKHYTENGSPLDSLSFVTPNKVDDPQDDNESDARFNESMAIYDLPNSSCGHYIESDNGEKIDTRKQSKFWDTFEKQREKLYTKYQELSLEIEEIKVNGPKEGMIDLERKIHEYFSQEALPHFLKLGLIDSLESDEKMLERHEAYEDSRYQGKIVSQKKFGELKEFYERENAYNLSYGKNYVYDLFAKSLRKIANYYKKQKMWEEALTTFNVIEDMGMAGINDKKSIIKAKNEVNK